MAGSAVNLTGMLGRISGALGSPAQLSEGQRGLFQTMGASLAPMPQVDQEDPASLRAAAAEAMRRGDAQTAQTYATMAQQVERSQFVKRGEARYQTEYNNSILDEGKAEVQAELNRKRAMAAQAAQSGQNALRTGNMSKALQAVGKPAEAALIQALGAENIPPGTLTQVFKDVTSGGDTYKPVSKYGKEAADMGFQYGSKEWAQYIAGRIAAEDKTTAKGDLSGPEGFMKISKNIDQDATFKTYVAQKDQSIRALELLESSADTEQSGALIQRVVSEIYNGDSKAASEIDRFVAQRGIPTRVSDWASNLASGKLSKVSKENMSAIAKVAKEFAEQKMSSIVSSKLDLYGKTDPEDRKKFHDAYGTSEVLGKISRSSPVGEEEGTGKPLYEVDGSYYYSDGTEWKGA